MSELNFKPIGPFILVKPEEAEKTTKSGIVIVEKEEERPQTGKVIALGNSTRMTDKGVEEVKGGYFNMSGFFVPFTVQIGDLIYFNKFGGIEIELNDEKYLLLTEDKIMGVFK